MKVESFLTVSSLVLVSICVAQPPHPDVETAKIENGESFIRCAASGHSCHSLIFTRQKMTSQKASDLIAGGVIAKIYSITVSIENFFSMLL